MTENTVWAKGAKTFPVIDFHAHVLEPGVYDKTINHNVISGFGARPMSCPTKDDPRWERFEQMCNPRRQIEDMDARGIDMHVVSTSGVSQSTWWAEPQEAVELDRRANEVIAEWVHDNPARFIGTFTLPMQSVTHSLQELAYAVETLGLRVANVPASINGVYLGDPQFRPLWEAFDHHDIPVLIHPDGVKDPRFLKYALWNGIGQPIEETMVMASLMYEGVLDAFSEVKIVMAHGGGYLPHYIGRLDRNAAYHPISAKNLRSLPSDYLRRFYYDTCVYDSSVLENLIRRVGADRIVLGSDYPVGDKDPLDILRRCSNVSGAELDMITKETPAEILGLGRQEPLARVV